MSRISSGSLATNLRATSRHSRTNLSENNDSWKKELEATVTATRPLTVRGTQHKKTHQNRLVVLFTLMVRTTKPSCNSTVELSRVVSYRNGERALDILTTINLTSNTTHHRSQFRHQASLSMTERSLDSVCNLRF